jgi:hypothetical protein
LFPKIHAKNYKEILSRMVNIWNLTCFYFTQLVQIVELYLLHSREDNCFETGKLEVYAKIIGGISMDIRYLSTFFF